MSGILNVLLAASAAGGVTVSITNQLAFGENRAGLGGTSTAKYRLKNDGVAQTGTFPTGGYADISGEWLTSGTAADFETQGTFTNNTGGTSTGPTTWVSLSTTREWTFETTNNDASCDLTVEIRLASSGVVLDSALIYMEAFSAP